MTSQHIFLSYRSIEIEFALKLAADLKNVGVNLWMARFDIKAGQEWRGEIEKALTPEVCAAMIAVVSPEYVKAEYCLKELARANSLKLPIFPILLRPVLGVEWPLAIEGVQYIDFTSWHDEPTYRQQLDALLKRLTDQAREQFGPIPDAETRYLNNLIAKLEAHLGVLEYVGLKGSSDAPPDTDPVRPAPRKIMAPGLSLLLPQNEERVEPALHEPQKVKLSDIREAVQKYPRFALIGEPGAGKTTTLQRLALEAARARLENPSTATLPFFVLLPSWDDEKRPADFVRKHWLDHGLPADIDPIDLLIDGTATLYLDGLNEMGNQGTGKAKKLVEWFQSIVAPSKVIVTCRSGDYVGDLKLGDMPTVLIEEMDEGKIREFATNYLKSKAIHFLSRILPPLFGDPFSLFSAWENSPNRWLLNLARNPYLLMALIILYESAPDGTLPRNNGMLFRELTQALWERERQKQTPGWVAFTEMEVDFSDLAFSIIEEGRPTEVPIDYVLTHVVSKELLNAGDSANILVVSEKRVRFYHPLMLEYFAAVELGRRGVRGGMPNLTLKRDLGNILRWIDIVVATCGLTNNPDEILNDFRGLNPILAAECITRGVNVSSSVRLKVACQLFEFLEAGDADLTAAAARGLSRIRRIGFDEAIILRDMTPFASPGTEHVEIVVALDSIQRGYLIKPRMVELSTWPLLSAPSTAFVKLEGAIGKFARRDIAAGEPILDDSLTEYVELRRLHHPLPSTDSVPTLDYTMTQYDIALPGKAEFASLLRILTANTAKHNRINAAERLGKLGNKNAVPSLIGVLRQDQQIEVQLAAAEALTLIGTPEALAAVETWQREHGEQR